MARLASQARSGLKPAVAVQADPRELMSIAHKRINVLSGTMVLAFRDGPKPKDFKRWADEMRMIAADLDRGWRS